MRKVRQFVVGSRDIPTVVCEDGTLWEWDGNSGEWDKWVGPPDAEPVQDSSELVKLALAVVHQRELWSRGDISSRDMLVSIDALRKYLVPEGEVKS